MSKNVSKNALHAFALRPLRFTVEFRIDHDTATMIGLSQNGIFSTMEYVPLLCRT
jgi:hypothetical protein